MNKWLDDTSHAAHYKQLMSIIVITNTALLLHVQVLLHVNITIVISIIENIIISKVL